MLKPQAKKTLPGKERVGKSPAKGSHQASLIEGTHCLTK